MLPGRFPKGTVQDADNQGLSLGMSFLRWTAP